MSRDRHRTDLWLALQPLETDADRARHGDPHNDAEARQRAVTAYAAAIANDRPDRIVLAERGEQPEPINGRPVRFLHSDTRPAITAFNPMIRNSIAAADGHGRIQTFDTSNGVPVHTPDGRPGPVTSLEYAPDGATLAVGARDGVVRLYAIEDW